MTARARWAAAVVAGLLVLAACGGGAGGGGAGGGGAEGPATSDVPASTANALKLTEEWVWPPPGGGSAGMPASDGDDIALTVGRQRVVLLDGEGAVRWEVRRNVRDVAPALTAALVLVATEQGLVALDRSTGRERWAATLDDRTNTPAVAGGRAVVTTWDGFMAAVDLADGQVVWRLKLGGNALGPPAVSLSTAVATFDTGRAAGATAVDLATGRPRWTAPLTPDGVSAPAIEGGVVVVVAADVAAHGLALDTGAELWRAPLDGSGSPEVPPRPGGDGAVLVGHRLGGMALLDSVDGAVRWSSARAGAAVRGGPAGPGPNGWYAMPLNNGRVAFAGPDREPDVRQPPSLAIGVAAGPRGLLLVATEQGRENGVSALSGW